MCEPSPEYGPDFWVKACGGKNLVTARIEVHWTLAELIYDKYCRPSNVPREHLYGVSRDRQTWKRVLILSCRFLADGFENRVEITKFVDNFILFQENSNN